ncbi:MAG TPA: hypothetical protein VFZ90_16835 [Gemmatimonadales bacterium]
MLAQPGDDIILIDHPPDPAAGDLRLRAVIMRRLFVLAAVCWVVACGNDDSTLQPSVGTLQITTVTTGTPTGEFTIIVDGASPRVIGPSATLSITDVDEGSHVVQLTLPTGCTAAGENPRTVSVTAPNTTTVDFAVTCS